MLNMENVKYRYSLFNYFLFFVTVSAVVYLQIYSTINEFQLFFQMRQSHQSASGHF